MSGHAVVSQDDYAEPTVRRLREALHERFGIDHVTIQLETEGFREAETHS